MTSVEKTIIYEKILKKILYAHATKNAEKLNNLLDVMSDWSFNSVLSEDAELKQLDVLYKLKIIESHGQKS